MKNASEQFYVISPDGFPIERENTYDTTKLAWEAFENWKEGYARQGYYSTVKNGERIKIPLGELKNHCAMRSYNSIS